MSVYVHQYLHRENRLGVTRFSAGREYSLTGLSLLPWGWGVGGGGSLSPEEVRHSHQTRRKRPPFSIGQMKMPSILTPESQRNTLCYEVGCIGRWAVMRY